MQITNVLSSHYPGSFNKVLMDAFVEAAEGAGHENVVYDLYGMNFNPVMIGDDFNQFMGKPLSEEILAYHERLSRTDILTFFYPVWWNDMPAIMKGWVDRVFAKGFAYDYDKTGARGMLQIKKVLLVCTLGNPADQVIADGLEEAMRVKERKGVFSYCGVEDVEHVFLYDVYSSEEIRQNGIERIKKLAASL